ncbi:MAG: hypothetical protein COW42_08855 [Deltaproteobacteria bacterium CG17_big_fil_post_rev_8_21_14_2_50_63_7]|nr:MAG: hypothetical protein COW42_08855 [Deltaproteobacteria bacterium CG17_big_fil_post_rev_8_21_14_2_50_63_7]
MTLTEVRTRLERTTLDVLEVVTPQTIPYFFWKKWNEMRTRGELGVLWDMLHADGLYKARYTDRDHFYRDAQMHPLPSGPDWVLEKIKVDEKEAYLLSSRGREDPLVKHISLEMMHLQRTVDGWRVFDVKSDRVTKGEGKVYISFANFGLKSAEHDFHVKVEGGYARPDLADHLEPEPEDETEEQESGESSPIAPMELTEPASDVAEAKE